MSSTRKKREHKRIVRRNQPGNTGRRKMKAHIRVACQRATRAAVRVGRKAAAR